MPAVQITRSHQLKVTMTPEMHARLVALSEKLGQSPATVASMAISQHVNQQEATLGAPQRMVDTMLSQLMPQLLGQLDQLPDAVEIKIPKLGPGWKNSPDSDEQNREPTSDEAAGMQWWNALSKDERDMWCRAAKTPTPAVAWEYFKRQSVPEKQGAKQ